MVSLSLVIRGIILLLHEKTTFHTKFIYLHYELEYEICYGFGIDLDKIHIFAVNIKYPSIMWVYLIYKEE